MAARDILLREMALTEAALSAVAARHRNVEPLFAEEARQILANFPDARISEAELAAEMERVFRRGREAHN